MKIVIDIDEETYADIKKGKVYSSYRDVPQESILAIANGTQLPKGHGKLMDADAFANFLKNISKTQRYNEFIIDKQLTGVTVDDVFNVICESLQDENSVPTIIEADTESEDNE